MIKFSLYFVCVIKTPIGCLLPGVLGESLPYKEMLISGSKSLTCELRVNMINILWAGWAWQRSKFAWSLVYLFLYGLVVTFKMCMLCLQPCCSVSCLTLWREIGRSQWSKLQTSPNPIGLSGFKKYIETDYLTHKNWKRKKGIY